MTTPQEIAQKVYEMYRDSERRPEGFVYTPAAWAETVPLQVQDYAWQALNNYRANRYGEGVDEEPGEVSLLSLSESLGATNLWLAGDYSANPDGTPAAWTDEIGSVVLAQDTHANKPTTVNVDGVDVIQFVGTQGALADGFYTAAGSTDALQCIALLRNHTATNNRVYLGYGRNNLHQQGQLLTRFLGGQIHCCRVGADQRLAGASLDSAWRVMYFKRLSGGSHFSDGSTDLVEDSSAVNDSGTNFFVGNADPNETYTTNVQIAAIILNTDGGWSLSQVNQITAKLAEDFADLSPLRVEL